MRTKQHPVIGVPLLFFALLLILGRPSAGQAAAQPQSRAAVQADSSQQVQSIFKANCGQCHQGSQAAGELSMDSKALMLKGGASGSAILPVNGDSSLILTRLQGGGGKPRMPLGFPPLSPAQIETIRSWIANGAPWPQSGKAKQHWAYIAPVRPPIPAVKNRSWIRNPIDSFVLARLEAAKLTPSPEADRTTLVRRVTLDLTGLPPTPPEIDAFLADQSPGAYDKVVDRLLANPHYGERMALPWLDAARYADSNGFQQDGDTYQYVWRDWVVNALNANMPFDKFTIDQLAGDLLPDASYSTRLATAFSRNHMLNGEGGAIPEEQRNIILFDRVDVAATTWLGATLACAQCHDHKYDPFTQRDYYSFMAFFNNVPESGVPPGGGQYRIADPSMPAGSDTQIAKLAALNAGVKTAEDRVAAYTHDHDADIAADQKAWEETSLKDTDHAPRLEGWASAGPFPATNFDAAYDTAFDPERGVALTAKGADGKLLWTAHPEWDDGKVHALTGENTATYLYRLVHANADTKITLSLGSDDAIKAWVNNSPVLADKVQRAAAPDEEKVTVNLHTGENSILLKIVNGAGIGGFYFKMTDIGLPADIVAILRTAAEGRTKEAAERLRGYFLANSAPPAIKTVQENVDTLRKERDAYETSLPHVMIMSDAMPRKTHILQRGNYEMPAAEVAPETPAFLPPMPQGAPKNRLGLAEWLVSPDNPLTARVQVNRYWQLFFGDGFVKTSENLGTQADPPTDQPLLDWLAVEFRESGWNVKHIQRLIVTSSTYRQSSKITPAMRLRDPENRLLARGARFRLPSMILRDVALASSGLLDETIGGKPVYPYQPKGIWDGLAITHERDFTYPQSKGADLYRRSLYTFWRRTVAPSNLFDASTRTTCKVRPSTTSTPLHALTTLNDVTWVEAGRALAEHVMKEAGPDPSVRLSEAFRRVCARRPTSEELRIMRRALDRALSAYRADPSAASAYLKDGDSPRDPKLDPAEQAAYAAVCLAIFNLDEALTRE